MKLMHLSDLHLGKRLHDASLMEDQAYILDQIISIARTEAPEAVLIAGDVYDKSLPPEEAVRMLDRFLCRLTELNIPVMLISGNHDSQERLSFGAHLMRSSGVHIAGAYQPGAAPVTLCDTFGEVDIHLLPFVKPLHVRQHFPEEEIHSTADAVSCTVRHMPIRAGVRSILVAHQFVAGGMMGGSEEMELSAGGSDQVPASVFAPFCYTALGHLHNPHHVGDPRIRYCGSPLKYSFDEAKFTKSVTIAEVNGDGDVIVRTAALTPLREVREIRGCFDDLINPDFLLRQDPEAYTRIVLLDDEDIPNAGARLHFHYRNLLQIDMEHQRSLSSPASGAAACAGEHTPAALLETFYRLQNQDQPMSEEQTAYLSSLMEKIQEEALL